jgi:RNA polymerase sigma-70 factor (ECF subfamily)
MKTIESIRTMAGEVNLLVDHLFRHKYAEVVATLTRIFGIEHLDLAEDVVQETLLKALRQWPLGGAPKNPGGWILQCAKNLAIDAIRRETLFRDKAGQIAYQLEQEMRSSADAPEDFDDGELKSDQLRMMFTCCHPALSQEVQVALTLKTLCGLSTDEIAKAFLTEEATIAQRLVRAKRKIRDEKIAFEMPAAAELPQRLNPILQVLYLLFNEGYNSHGGENLIRDELCAEAIRLAMLLAEHPLGDAPIVHALLALMLLQASRLPARIGAQGKLLLLAEQNRSQWDRDLISRGLHHLEKSSAASELTIYHLQAGIASLHATAASYESTDWKRILSFYDTLSTLDRSPVVALNRAVALAMIDGPKAGIAALKKIEDDPALQSYYLLPAAFGEFYRQLGDLRRAGEYYNNALTLAGTEPERRFLIDKIQACGIESMV